MFMPQTIPIKTYVLITICTLGVGVVYWLYKVVNLYNAHYKAELQVEKEVSKLTEEERVSDKCKERRFVSHGGDIWGFSRKYNVPLEEVLEFSGPINFLGPSPKAVEAVKQYAKFIKFYPDPNPVEFKEKIAKYVGHGVDEENIVLGNGSIELIYAITEILPRHLKR